MRRVLASALATVVALVLADAAAAADPIVDWSSGRIEGVVLPGEAPDGRAALRLVSKSTQGSTFALAEVDDPKITGDRYSVVGRVRYEGVEGAGYLEMWSVFADGGRYFTRTLAGSGPLGKLHGTSGWRAFELPFFLEGNAPPNRLELNVVLPGRGIVVLGPLSLAPAGSAAGWWSERTAGVVGAIAGSVIGLIGAVFGVLAARARARRFVIGALLGMVAIGAVLLGVDVVAVVTGQPSHVWYPVLLAGAIPFVLGLALWRPVRGRYAEVELRRMRALDLAGPAPR